MAQEITLARERRVDSSLSRNTVSKRTRSFDSDVMRAIMKRGYSLQRQYSGYRGLYQTIEMLTPTEMRNQRRIGKAVKNMTLNLMLNR